MIQRALFSLKHNLSKFMLLCYLTPEYQII